MRTLKLTYDTICNNFQLADEERSLAEKVLSSERTEFPIEDVGDFQQLSPQLQQVQ